MLFLWKRYSDTFVVLAVFMFGEYIVANVASCSENIDMS